MSNWLELEFVVKTTTSWEVAYVRKCDQIGSDLTFEKVCLLTIECFDAAESVGT